MSTTPTILDVLDATLDGRGPEAFLGPQIDVFEFLRSAREFYESWSAPAREDGEIRVFSTANRWRGFHRFPAVAIQASDERIAAVSQSDDLEGAVLSHLRKTAAGALLYADTVVEIDPISYLVESSVAPWDEEAAIAHLRSEVAHTAAMLLSKARPLIDAGVVILAPAPRAKHLMFTDIKSASEILGVVTKFNWEGMASPEVRLLAEVLFSLRVASAADATLLGDHGKVWQIIRSAVAGPNRDAGVKIAMGLAEVQLPFLAGISCETVLKIRNDDEGFAAWRSELREVARLISSAPEDEGFMAEARTVFEDHLMPRAADVMDSVSRSRALRGALQNAPLEAAFGAIATGSAGGALGLPLSEVLIGAAGGALGKVGASVVRPPRPRGSARVLYELVR